MTYPTKRSDNSQAVETWFNNFYETFISNKGDFSRVINKGFQDMIIGTPKGHSTIGASHMLHVTRGGDDYYKRRTENLEEVIKATKLFAYKDHTLASSRLVELQRAFKHNMPNATFPEVDTSSPMSHIKLIQNKKDLLQIKIDVIHYWIQVAEEKIEPDVSEAFGNAYQTATALKHHYLLQSNVDLVTKMLELMVSDANKIVQTPKINVRTELKTGLNTNSEFKMTKEFLNCAIQAKVSASYGISCSKKFELRYDIPVKIDGNLEVFAGARATASLDGSANVEGVNFTGEISGEVGLIVSGNVTMDFDYLLNVEAGGKAIAGALGNAGVKLVWNGQEVNAEAATEIFAGLKVQGDIKAGFKYDNITFMTWTGKGSASLGVGATAKATFACDIFGTVSVGAEAGATVGTGATLGAEFALTPAALATACEQIYFDGMHLVGYNARGYRHFIQPEKNKENALKAIRAISELRVKLATEQACFHDLEIIDAWNRRLDLLRLDSAARRIASL